MADSNEVIGETLRHILEALVSIRDSIEGVRYKLNELERRTPYYIDRWSERASVLEEIHRRNIQIMDELVEMRSELEASNKKSGGVLERLWRKV